MIPDFGQTRILVFEYEKHISSYSRSQYLFTCVEAAQGCQRIQSRHESYMLLIHCTGCKMLRLQRFHGDLEMFLCCYVVVQHPIVTAQTLPVEIGGNEFRSAPRFLQWSPLYFVPRRPESLFQSPELSVRVVTKQGWREGHLAKTNL